jgi:hypothetical protein
MFNRSSDNDADLQGNCMKDTKEMQDENAIDTAYNGFNTY